VRLTLGQLLRQIRQSVRLRSHQCWARRLWARCRTRRRLNGYPIVFVAAVIVMSLLKRRGGRLHRASKPRSSSHHPGACDMQSCKLAERVTCLPPWERIGGGNKPCVGIQECRPTGVVENATN
jgi:hypothetical protein